MAETSTGSTNESSSGVSYMEWVTFYGNNVEDIGTHSTPEAKRPKQTASPAVSPIYSPTTMLNQVMEGSKNESSSGVSFMEWVPISPYWRIYSPTNMFNRVMGYLAERISKLWKP